MTKDTVTEKTVQHKSIAQALAAAQMDMGKALKSATNPHFKSKYADLGAVVEACLPALNKHGIAVIQPMTDGETGRCVVTTFIHESGETLSCPIPLIVAKNDMQGLGSAMTYARRYGLMALAGIAPEDDDGNAAVAAAPPPPKPTLKPEPFDAKAMFARLKDAISKRDDKESLDALWMHKATGDAVVKMPDHMQAELAKIYSDRMEDLSKRPSDSVTQDEIPY